MRTLFTFVAVAAVSVGAGAARADGAVPFPEFQFNWSLPLQFNTNSLLAPSNAQSDFFVSPLVKLVLGDLHHVNNPDLSYSVYALASPDAYARVHTADDAVATVGARVQKSLGNFGIGSFYEHSLEYGDVFNSLQFQANDFNGYIGYSYQTKGLQVQPLLTVGYRLADLASQDRVLYTLKADITKDLTEDQKWQLVLTPRVRYYSFSQSTNAGRQDTRWDILAGVTYNITKDLSTTASVQYDTRYSNMSAHNFNNTTFALSLDYSHTYRVDK